MGKLTKLVYSLLGDLFEICKVSKSFTKSCGNYINETNKINKLKQIILDILNNSLDLNITNYQYTNHTQYGNAWHCHIQSDFILVYDFDENGNLILIDLINHNEQ